MATRDADNSAQINSAHTLQHREQLFSTRQYANDIVQRLTYFIVSAELVTCGYILLNADSLVAVRNINYLFLSCGVAAMMGILWRFFYKITYYNNAHGVDDFWHKISKKLQIIVYYIYVPLTLMTFSWLLITSYLYLTSLSI